MWSRRELKERAKEILNLNYWKAVLVSLIFAFIGGNGGLSVSVSSSSSNVSGNEYYNAFKDPEALAAFLAVLSVVLIIVVIMWLIALALSIFVFNPLKVGCQRYFILCGKAPAAISEVVFAFSHSYMNIVKIMFFKDLYTFLWALLLIIPGIIKGYEYRMIPYLLAEKPDMDMKEAFALTKKMMDGDKGNAFVLDLSFLGWNLLGALTCCILNIFYVHPYQNLTNARLYEVLKQKIGGIGRGNVYNQPYVSNAYNPYL